MARPVRNLNEKSENKNGQNAAKFESYSTDEEVNLGLANGTLIEGVLRINPKNYREAFITSPDGSADIIIEGLLNRNKALNGDVVVVTLLTSDTKEIKSCDFNKEPDSLVVTDGTPNRKLRSNKKSPAKHLKVKKLAENKSPGPKLEIKVCDTKVQENQTENHGSASKDTVPSDSLLEEENLKENIASNTSPQTLKEENSEVAKKKRSRRSKRKKNGIDDLSKQFSTMSTVQNSEPQAEVVRNVQAEDNGEVTRKVAKVILLKERKHSCRAIGTLRPWPQNQTPPKWILFAPKDHRIPRLKIPFNRDLMTDCTQQPNMLYLAKIDEWVDVQHPLGSLCYSVGPSGNLEAETLALLLEHGVDYQPFPAPVLENLPRLPWSIPADELAKRRDFRNHCIFTIDPSDARDLDDAVCGRFLKLAEDGSKLYQVSVHIADVSFFIQEDSALDQMAAERATSTYLVDRVIPMLPSVLCEHVCSLNPGEDRLAFSVEWIINDQGEIIEEWFGRSVIRSCVKLSYDHAQGVIEGRDDIQWPAIKGTHSLSEIKETIGILQELASRLREKRVREGALRIDLPRLTFNMDWKTRTPIGFRVYELKESNRLIEEFMLLANTRVAQKIYSVFPDIAVLRCHPPPNILKLKQLSESLEALGIHLDISSSKTLQDSLLRYGQAGTDAISLGRNLVISNLVAKPMQRAIYICSGIVSKGELFRHYALSVPFYTHFTSPIRRYPDVLVHRLLQSAIAKESMNHWNAKGVAKVMDNCNARKIAAKTLQESHSELHLSALIRKSGSIEVKGIVLAVLDHAVDVVLLYMGVIRRLYLEKLPADLSYDKEKGMGELTLIWNQDNSCAPLRQCITLFSILEILLVPHEKEELQFNLVLQRPTNVETAIPRDIDE
uniref:EOG090X047D n=1 Tax=Evadne anonyx TaxID=141404 RepID=A0A9N6WRN1_9CRUS|nr:EOG090X047D [Evadne anonyx]